MSATVTAVSTFADTSIDVSTATGQRKGIFTMGTKIYVGYLRVSTDRQGKSGLGLESQRATISAHVNGNPYVEFLEVESGKRNDRPELSRALAECRRKGATLIIAKLDRLSRNARFILELLDSDVELEFCDLPQCSGPAGRMMLTMMGGFAEMEAGLISERTKAALAACKARGVRLGNPNGAQALVRYIRAHGNGKAMAGKAKAALARAENWRETLESLVSKGLSHGAIARMLTNRGETTVCGGKWSACAVGRLVRRLEIAIPA